MLALGPTETEGMHALGFVGSGMDTAMIAQTPLGQLGQPQDVAPVAVFLAPEESAWIRGELLLDSGGLC